MLNLVGNMEDDFLMVQLIKKYTIFLNSKLFLTFRTIFPRYTFSIYMYYLHLGPDDHGKLF